MTKKHFEAIAGAISQLKPKDKETMIAALLPVLEESNPQFDEKRFRAACLKGK
jgi:hypothetical protein